MAVPATVKLPMLADLTRPMAGFWVAGTVVVEVSVTGGPVGGVPVAVPVLVTAPASRSAWVVV